MLHINYIMPVYDIVSGHPALFSFIKFKHALSCSTWHVNWKKKRKNIVNQQWV